MMRGRHAPQPDWYAVLDVAPGADAAAIKAAHRRRARDLHPDVNPAPDATERMAELNRARDVLLDPPQRAAFDRTRQPQPAGMGERMKFSFATEQPAGRTPGRSGQPHPSTEERARDAERWRFDPSADPAQENWYAFLGVAPWTTSDEVRQACARLAGEATDPRLSVAERARRAAKLRTAAETLGNTERKQAYDNVRPPWRPGRGPLPDHYRLLGVRPKAAPEEVAEAVTNAHLALGKIRSPEARAKDAAIREAHWVLRDPARRAAYDETRSRG